MQCQYEACLTSLRRKGEGATERLFITDAVCDAAGCGITCGERVGVGVVGRAVDFAQIAAAAIGVGIAVEINAGKLKAGRQRELVLTVG